MATPATARMGIPYLAGSGMKLNRRCAGSGDMVGVGIANAEAFGPAEEVVDDEDVDTADARDDVEFCDILGGDEVSVTDAGVDVLDAGKSVMKTKGLGTWVGPGNGSGVLVVGGSLGLCRLPRKPA